MIAGKFKWEEGRVSGAVYAGDPTVGDICSEAGVLPHCTFSGQRALLFFEPM